MLQLPITLVAGSAKMHQRHNVQFKGLLQSKRDTLLRVAAQDPLFETVWEISQEIDDLHSEQLRVLRQNASIFDCGTDEDLTLEQFRIAAKYEARTWEVSYWVEQFNRLVPKLAQLEERDKEFLLNWTINDPTPVEIPGLTDRVRRSPAPK